MGAEKEIGSGKFGLSSNIYVQRSKNEGSGWRWTEFDVGVSVHQVISPFCFQ